VHLFDLNRILKYKKGRLLERQLELEKLRNLIIENLPARQPSP
jgi:predicted RNase H-like nuclease